MVVPIIRGEMAVERGRPIRTGMQTCCAIVYYDKKGLYGVAHAVVPSSREYDYRRGGERIKEGFIVTPTQAANSLLERMIQNGARREDLSAGIFGCRNDSIRIGTENSSEARNVLKKLDIPVSYDITDTPYDIRLILAPDGIHLRLLEGQKEIGRKSFRYI